MLNYLFGGLTARPARGTPLFDAVTKLARQPHWYLAGKVPDTIDGRFAMLATITAMAMIRIEALGDAGIPLSVALTERFIEVMEAEHRELGLGDPTLGKTVRKLVGALARKVDLWRAALSGQRNWTETVADCLPIGGAGVEHCATALRSVSAAFEAASIEQLADGHIE